MNDQPLRIRQRWLSGGEQYQMTAKQKGALWSQAPMPMCPFLAPVAFTSCTSRPSLHTFEQEHASTPAARLMRANPHAHAPAHAHADALKHDAVQGHGVTRLLHCRLANKRGHRMSHRAQGMATHWGSRWLCDLCACTHVQTAYMNLLVPGLVPVRMPLAYLN